MLDLSCFEVFQDQIEHFDSGKFFKMLDLSCFEVFQDQIEHFDSGHANCGEIPGGRTRKDSFFIFEKARTLHSFKL